MRLPPFDGLKVFVFASLVSLAVESPTRAWSVMNACMKRSIRSVLVWMHAMKFFFTLLSCCCLLQIVVVKKSCCLQKFVVV